MGALFAMVTVFHVERGVDHPVFIRGMKTVPPKCRRDKFQAHRYFCLGTAGSLGWSA